jgi:hypothetical protein
VRAVRAIPLFLAGLLAGCGELRDVTAPESGVESAMLLPDAIVAPDGRAQRPILRLGAGNLVRCALEKVGPDGTTWSKTLEVRLPVAAADWRNGAAQFAYRSSRTVGVEAARSALCTIPANAYAAEWMRALFLHEPRPSFDDGESVVARTGLNGGGITTATSVTVIGEGEECDPWYELDWECECDGPGVEAEGALLGVSSLTIASDCDDWDDGGGSGGDDGGTGGGGTTGESAAEIAAQEAICEQIDDEIQNAFYEDDEAVPDYLWDAVMVLWDIGEIVVYGPTCGRVLTTLGDLLAFIAPGVPAPSSGKKIDKLTDLLDAARRGREAHAAFRNHYRNLGHIAERRLPSGKQLDAVVVDPVNRTVTVLELKPDHPGAISKGMSQLFGGSGYQGYVNELRNLNGTWQGLDIPHLRATGYQFRGEIVPYSGTWTP